MTLSSITARQRLGLGGAALLAIGIAAGAGAVSLTRPTTEMAPTITIAVSRLPGKIGVVTVRGRVAAVYGDRFLIQDPSGRALVEAGRRGTASLRIGTPIMVQGRFDDGQLHAHYLVDAAGDVQEVGGRGPHDRDAPPPPHGPDGPPPPTGPAGPERAANAPGPVGDRH